MEFLRAGMLAIIRDESRLERYWFFSEPLAAIHVEVKQADYLRAREAMTEWEATTELLRQAVRCPECRSSCIEFPQVTRKFFTPALYQLAMIALHVVPRQYYCLHCHFSWPKVAKPAPELDVLGWPLNSKFWHPERFPKPPKAEAGRSPNPPAVRP